MNTWFMMQYFLQKLCAKGAHSLQTKSQTVEESVSELITMLCVAEPDDGEGGMEEPEKGFEDETADESML